MRKLNKRYLCQSKKLTQLKSLIHTPEHALWLANFINIYQKLSTDNLHLFADIYHQDIVFTDPMHQLMGLDNLRHYFDQLYQQLSYCEFKIEQVIAAR